MNFTLKIQNLIRDIWNIILSVGFLIIILCVGLFLFTLPDQAKDFVYVMLQNKSAWSKYLFLVSTALVFWSFITWYSACIMLQTDPMNFDLSKKYVQKIVLYIPRIFGIIPFIIIIVAFLVTPNLSNESALNNAVLWLLFLSVIMYLCFFYLDKRSDRKKINQKDLPTKEYWPTYKHLQQHYQYNNINKERSKGKIPSFKEEVIFINHFIGMKVYFWWIGIVVIVFTVIMCINNIALYISGWLKPATILILILTLYTYTFTLIYYFNDLKARPILIGIFGWILICSNFNNNTSPFYVKPTINVDDRLTPQDAFSEWTQKKWRSWKDSFPNHDSMPVYFIATQGGGIRGVHWTVGVFNFLDSVTKGAFYKQVFCISGVSGGGVGASFYNAYYFDRIQNKYGTLPISNNTLDRFIAHDFLSPVTASFGFSDNLQRFLPFPVKRLDRSKMLALNWKERYKDELNSETMEMPFLQFWYNEAKEFETRLPSLLINGTLAENGQRVITSNLKLENNYFKDDLDFYSCTREDISMASAILNCCRFPYLTSGGLMKKDGCAKGHIVDGGYRENSGLQSLLNLYYTLLPQIIKPADTTIRIKPVIIYLKNGVDELNTSTQAASFLHDFLTPMNGILAVNGTAMPSKGIETMAKQIIEQSHTTTGAEYHLLWLEDRKDKTIRFPLGWYISDTVINEIKKRTTEIPIRDTFLYQAFIKEFK